MTLTVTERKTARLRLRRIVADDVAEIVAISSDPRTNRHRPGGAPSPEQASEIASGFVRDWAANAIGYWVVEHQGVVIGVAGVKPCVQGGRDAWNLYYRFAAGSWGKGLAAEAAREAVAVAAALSPGRPVIARTRAGNRGAIRVAQAAGLQRRADLDGDGFIVFADTW